MNYLLKKRLVALIYPTRCPVCRCVIFPLEDFCVNCRDNLRSYNGDFQISGAKLFTSAFEYDDNISPAIFQLKDGIKGNAPYALGKAIAERVIKLGISGKIDFIIPVPMYPDDKKKRGFNQSELIANQVGRILKIDVCTDIVEKILRTKPQKNLTKQQRKINLNDAFDIKNAESVRCKRILLLDDVCTTGSTLTEITKLLKSKGANEVYCVSCCKTGDLPNYLNI